MDNIDNYLIAAEVDPETNQIVPGTVTPLSDQHMALKMKKSDTKLTYAKTDEFGLIRQISKAAPHIPSQMPGSKQGKRFIQLLTKELVETCIYCKDPNESSTTTIWHKQIHTLVNSNLNPDNKKDQLFDVLPFKGSDIAKLKDAKSKILKDKWNKHFNSTHYGIVIPKMKHLVIILPFQDSNSNNNFELEFIGDNKESIVDKYSNKLETLTFKIPTDIDKSLNTMQEKTADYIMEDKKVIGMIITKPSGELPNGIYNIKVTWSGKKFYNHETKSQTDYYHISTKCDFGMHTIMGDMDIINATPISLEEHIFMQYSKEYAHLQSALKSNMELPEGAQDDPFNIAKSNLEKYVDVAKILKSKHDYIKGVYDDGFSPILDSTLSMIAQSNDYLKTSYSLYTGITKSRDLTKKIRGTWEVNKALFNYFDAASNMSKTSKLVRFAQAQDMFSTYGANVMKAILEKPQYANLGFNIFEGNDEVKKYRFLMARGVPLDEIDKIDLLPDKGSAYTKYGDILGYVDIAFSAYDALLSWNGYWDATQNEEKEKEEYIKKVESIAKLALPGGSREVLGTMIKSRTAVNMKSMKVDEEVIKAWMATFDLAISIASVFPATAMIAGAIMAVKTLGETVKLTGTNALDFIEKEWPSFIGSQAYAKHKILNVLNKEMEKNYDLLTDKKSLDLCKDSNTKDVYMQSRAHQEVIRAITAIINRLSSRVYFGDARKEKGHIDYGKFNEKLREYKFNDFIETYLFSEGWCLPDKHSLPIGLDTLWLYRTGSGRDSQYFSRSDFSTSNYYASNDYNQYDLCVYGLKPKNGQVPSGHFGVNFQKYFPVNFINNKKTDNGGELNYYNLAHVFSRNYTGVIKLLRWTQIYYRKAPGKGETLPINANWRPLSEIGRKRKGFTTGIQLRIVVAFDEGVDVRAVPLSIQINRNEPDFDINGPIYKISCDKLDYGEGGLLKDTAEIKYGESELVGKLGKVFFPFYQFGEATFFGPKPLEYDLKKVQGVNHLFASLFRGYVTDPNEYNFTLKLGDKPKGGTKTKILYSNNVVDFRKDKGEGDFFFRLDTKNELGAAMKRSQAFLTSLSATEETPALIPKGSKTGIVGIMFHGENNRNFYLPVEDVDYKGISKLHKDIFNMPGEYAALGKKMEFSVILYSRDVNELDFTRTKGYIHNFTASPCSACIKEHSLYENFNNYVEQTQIAKSTLYYLGYNAVEMSDPDRLYDRRTGFQYRSLPTSINYATNPPSIISGVGSKCKWVDLPKSDTAIMEKELEELIAWGNDPKMQNFRSKLFRKNGIGNEQFYFFAAKFSMTYKKDGKTVEALDPKFKKKFDFRIHVNAAGGWVEKSRPFKIA